MALPISDVDYIDLDEEEPDLEEEDERPADRRPGLVPALSRFARRFIRPVLLGALFCLSFLIPLVFASYFRGMMQGAEDDSLLLDSDLLFRDGLGVNAVGDYVKLDHESLLNPSQDKDFLLVGWFRFRRLPLEGERHFLVSKYRHEGKLTPGYAVAVSNTRGEYRPEVYWEDAQGKGSWYTFAEFPLAQKSWTMFALSFRDGKLLGLHFVQPDIKSARDVKLLGGYETTSLPATEAPVYLGAYGSNKFRGRIGAFGAFEFEDLTPLLPELLTRFASAVDRFPPELPKEANGLWWTGTSSTAKAHSFRDGKEVSAASVERK